MEFLLVIARLCFSLIFILSGFNHISNAGMMTKYAKSKNFPSSKFTTILSGVAIIFGGITVLFGFWVQIGALILTVFLLVTAFGIHHFWTLEDPMEKMNDQNHFLKDLALAGAAFIIWYFGTGPWSIG